MPRHGNISLVHFTRQVLPPLKPTRVVQACGRFVLLVPWKLEFPNADRKTWQTLIRATSAGIVCEELGLSCILAMRDAGEAQGVSRRVS